MIRKPKRPKKGIDIVCTAAMAGVLFTVAFVNLLQPDRPTVSLSEKRTLAKMPELSVSSLLSGEYLNGLSLFLSDTFVGREALVDCAKSMDVLCGVDYKVDGKQLIILDAGEAGDGEEEEGDDTVEEDPGIGDDPIWSPSYEDDEKDDEYITEPLDTLPAGTGEETDMETVPDTGDEPAETEKPSNRVVRTSNDAEFFKNGLFIYGDAVYIPPSLSINSARNYLNIAKKYENFFGYPVRVSVLPIPTSSIVLEGGPVDGAFKSAKPIIEGIVSCAPASVNVVDVYSALTSHNDEYLYFKTDHHWTALGAYYAYTAFADSMGFTPTPLADFEHLLLNDNFHGTLYSYTKDERVRSFHDELHAYVPTKEHTMTITADTYKKTYKCCIKKSKKTYLAFIGGDNAFTEITVPGNPSELAILVFKDSFGDAFVPYLCEHYGKIYVIDPRYFDGDLAETFANRHLSDVLFANAFVMMGSGGWRGYYSNFISGGSVKPSADTTAPKPTETTTKAPEETTAPPGTVSTPPETAETPPETVAEAPRDTAVGTEGGPAGPPPAP